MSQDVTSQDLRKGLRRLTLSRMLDTLTGRLALARQQKLPHRELLLLVLQDGTTRRDTQAATLRAQKARLDPMHQIRSWDETAMVDIYRLRRLLEITTSQATQPGPDKKPASVARFLRPAEQFASPVRITRDTDRKKDTQS